jgi:hypothetical protein
MLLAAPAWATSYFISPSGSDGANGLTTGTAWLSPNHALNCGDTISAATGTYSASNFQSGKWGAVACAGNNNVAWLACATFDACKLSSTTGDAMWVDKPYWGVQGWEATTTTSTSGACFHIGPNGASGIVHHVIMVNDVANGCMGSGFTAYGLNSSGANVDYIAYLGDIAYNAAQGTSACYSGFNIGYPGNYDAATGTHMFVAGSFSWANVDGNNCGGNTGTTDGEGFNFDTWDLSQLSSAPVYTGQGAIENSIAVLNGGYGAEVENNAAGSTHANIYFVHLTTFGNHQDANGEYKAGNGDMYIYNASNVSYTYNLTDSGYQYDDGTTNAYYAFAIGTGNGTDAYDYNFSTGRSGNNTFINASTGFALGSHNTIGTSPAFSSAVNPGAPSCSGKTNTVNCAATLIADYTATASGAPAYGYQTVSNTSIADALFPQWLCTSTGVLNANIPAGLVTPGCGVLSGSSIGSLLTSGIKITAGSEIQ